MLRPARDAVGAADGDALAVVGLEGDAGGGGAGARGRDGLAVGAAADEDRVARLGAVAPPAGSCGTGPRASRRRRRSRRWRRSRSTAACATRALRAGRSGRGGEVGCGAAARLRDGRQCCGLGERRSSVRTAWRIALIRRPPPPERRSAIVKNPSCWPGIRLSCLNDLLGWRGCLRARDADLGSSLSGSDHVRGAETTHCHRCISPPTASGTTDAPPEK